MKDKTVYLLYNTNSNDIKLHKRAKAQLDEEKGKHVWEYIDKDMFTITYSPEDERKYTDIKIVSKTKLKNRPKSVDVVSRQPKGNVEGVLIRKSSSLSNIEELFLARRGPLIKPLLSEAEITRLQQLQEECRRMHYEYEKRRKLVVESDSKEITTLSSLTIQDIKTTEEITKYSHLKSSVKNELQNITPLDLIGIRKFRGVKSDREKSVKRGTDSYNKKGDTADKTVRKVKPVQAKKSKFRKERETKQKRTEKLSARRKEEKSKFKKSVDNKVKSPLIVMEKDNKIDRHNKNKLVEGKLTEKKKSLSQLKQNIMKQPAMSRSLKRDFSGYDLDLENKEFEKKHPIGKNKSDLSKTKIVAIEKQDSRDISFSATSKSDKSSKAKTPEQLEGKTIKQGERKTVEQSGMQSAADDKTRPSNKSSKEEKRLKSKDKISYKVKSPRDKLEDNEGPFPNKGSLKSRSRSKPGSSKPVSATSTVKKSRSSSVHLSVSEIKGKVKEGFSSRGSRKFSSLQNIIQYVLSNPAFIKLGWTLPPIDRALSLVVTFNALPASSQNYCFRNRDEVETKLYPSGNLAVRMEKDGTGKVYYPSGSPAMIIKRSDIGLRLTLYTDPKRDALIKDSFHARVIGLFDSFGNGVVYNSQGKKILNFNQLEGIFNDPVKKTVYKWRWNIFELLEKQRVKELLSSMVTNEPEPKIGKGKKMVSSIGGTMKVVKADSGKKSEIDHIYKNILAELPQPMPRKSKQTVRIPSAGFKTIVLKINEEMALRINGQDNLVVHFLSNKVFYRLELGVVIDPETVIRIDELSAEKISEVPCIFNDLLHLSPSLQELQKNLLNPDVVHKRKSFLWKKLG